MDRNDSEMIHDSDVDVTIHKHYGRNESITHVIPIRGI